MTEYTQNDFQDALWHMEQDLISHEDDLDRSVDLEFGILYTKFLHLKVAVEALKRCAQPVPDGVHTCTPNAVRAAMREQTMKEMRDAPPR